MIPRQEKLQGQVWRLKRIVNTHWCSNHKPVVRPKGLRDIETRIEPQQTSDSRDHDKGYGNGPCCGLHIIWEAHCAITTPVGSEANVPRFSRLALMSMRKHEHRGACRIAVPKGLYTLLAKCMEKGVKQNMKHGSTRIAPGTRRWGITRSVSAIYLWLSERLLRLGNP